MKVSEFYKLNKTQPFLDFIDVDITNDTELFIDPGALRSLDSEWGNYCVSLLQDFFHTVLVALNNDTRRARLLLGSLHEPNETHLGLSRDKSQGHALSGGLALKVVESLMTSEAVKSGLLIDLEDTILMVEGIAKDVISDITTNIIREPLIEYTKYIAEQTGIPLQEGISSGPIWDVTKKKWIARYVGLPTTTSGKLLLVPKVIVRRKLDFDPSEYYTQYILPDLEDKEISANTALVHLLKDKRKKVYKKDLRKKYGEGKEAIIRLTRESPSLLNRYRITKKQKRTSALSHKEISEIANVPIPDWDGLILELKSVQPGLSHADKYHRIIEQILTPLFYPELTSPIIEYPIHEGRKRIDIAYSNISAEGFFNWAGRHYPAANVFIECKNYSGDPGNPELDQIAGRFSPTRGTIGFLVARNFNDKVRFIKGCRDTALDKRGFIIPLDDQDIIDLVEIKKTENIEDFFVKLKSKFDALV